MESGKRDFDLESVTWDEEPRRVQLAKDLFAAITETVVLSSSMAVLDFGCGTGLLTLPLAAQVGHVTGIDSSQGMLDVLKSKARQYQIDNVTTRRIDVACGDVLEGHYDLVVSSMTLHHVPDIPPLLKQFSRILRPGAYLCIADLDVENGEFHANNEGVFHFGFDRVQLSEVLSKTCFVNIGDKTAAEVIKPGADGQTRAFTVFLLAGQRAVAPCGGWRRPE